MTPAVPQDIQALHTFLHLSEITQGPVVARITAGLPCAVETLRAEASWPAWVLRDTGPHVRALIGKRIRDIAVSRLSVIWDCYLPIKPRLDRDVSKPFNVDCIIEQCAQYRERTYGNMAPSDRRGLYFQVVDGLVDADEFVLAAYLTAAAEEPYPQEACSRRLLHTVRTWCPKQLDAVLKIINQGDG